MSSIADSLEELWLGGREGTLSSLESLKVFALYTVHVEQGASEKKVFAKVAEKVTKLGGGSQALTRFANSSRRCRKIQTGTPASNMAPLQAASVPWLRWRAL